MEYEIIEKRMFLDDIEDRKALELLLTEEGIKLDKNLEYTVGIYSGERLIGTGSFFKNTLRCLAVSREYQGLGLMNRIASHLMNEEYQRGYTHIFLYTKGGAAETFKDMGFYEIERIKDVLVFMENRKNGIREYAEGLYADKVVGDSIASIVVNANPFTLGHQYLIEKAASENDVLHVFVVSEEASVVPASVRYELVKQGTKHLKNVVLHKSGDYIISHASFPSYFIKEEESVVRLHAELDIRIFADYIAKSLGIRRRYVGEEPFDEVTRTYNEVMKESLEERGIECIIIPRFLKYGEAVSASRVRRYIRENNLESIKDLVPYTTYDYFKSREGKALIEKIKKNHGRH
ncbi:[citrate (pro-3S)-lyase] ligase [Clostridium polynesiense]|uniref:[citrate (pro-3S)-lyase] ligase n=1 Tax=Clostridium polynesiense TaxID=1325933 RepID=UPI000AEC68F3|nr:[citrate (pro-3S)-lyase] ligase [Clostridium polynesiense]